MRRRTAFWWGVLLLMLLGLGHLGLRRVALTRAAFAAAGAGNVAEVERLLRLGADPYARDARGRTARELTAFRSRPLMDDTHFGGPARSSGSLPAAVRR